MNASAIISDVLVYGMYGACAMVVGTMALFSTKLRRWDERDRERARERKVWEDSPEGQAQIRAEAIEMEQSAHRATLEKDWPQYTILEMP